MIPIVGFAPDLDPTTPGVLVDCSNLVPTENGFIGAPSQASVGVAALAAACHGSASLADLSGNRRLFAGTTAKLYELSGASWTDRSRGAGYTTGADDRWSFIQNGAAALAATPTAVIQRSTSGAFADISGAPQAKLIEAAKGFAMALNTSTSSDEWYCSAYLDDTDWSLSVTTQCVKGRLVGGSGGILAARRFQDNIVAYKGSAMFVGQYVGAPEVWRWDQVSTDVGCIGQDAVVDTAYGHLFVGRDNIYVFDGTTPQPIANGTVRRWLFGDINPTQYFRTTCLWERARSLLWLFYPSAASTGTLDRCIVYHAPTKRWGLAHQTIEAIVNYSVPTMTYDGGPAGYTYDGGPTIPYDSLYWTAGQEAPGVFNSAHTLCTLTGQCSSASFTTGDFGTDEQYSYCDNLFVRYSTKPTTSTGTGYVKDEEGALVTAGTAVASADGKHPMRQRARWHRFKVDTTGDFTLTGAQPRLQTAGTR